MKVMGWKILAILFVASALTSMSHAQPYSATKTAAGPVEVIRLADAARGIEVAIVPSIGNIAYEMKVRGKNIFWFPYDAPAELKEKPVFAGNLFLAPWANRLDGDAFWANGRKYALNPDLGNLRRDEHGKPIHGLLLFSSAWEVAALHADDRRAEVTSRLEFWKYPELMAQFPFAHAIEMTYRLEDGALEVITRIENHSREPMPLAVGYHPYFRLHDSPHDEWRVHLAAKARLVLSSQFIPTGQREPVQPPDPVPLAGRSLDDVFTNLVRDSSGRSEFFVEGKKEKISVIYGPKYSVAVIYAPAGRGFICFEPMSAITNAFNLTHAGLYDELQSIPPGGVWQESYWIRPSGF